MNIEFIEKKDINDKGKIKSQKKCSAMFWVVENLKLGFNKNKCKECKHNLKYCDIRDY